MTLSRTIVVPGLLAEYTAFADLLREKENMDAQDREDLELIVRETKRAREIVLKQGAFRVDQFKNPANPAAHRDGTGEEIWVQSGGTADNFVAIAGTGGTFVGTSAALKRHSRKVKCYVVEPSGSPVLAGRRVTSPKHKIQGTGYALVPEIWDPSLCDGYLTVTDAEAVACARRLARSEGILSGFSGGANVAASLKLAEGLSAESTIVTIVPDTGLKYLSTDLFP
jgi:cysteine synthase A